MSDEIKDCPLCGCENTFDPPYKCYSDLAVSYDICSCCGCEFGLDDSEAYFDEWLASGGDWLMPEEKPENWKLEDQLKNIVRPYSHFDRIINFK